MTTPANRARAAAGLPPQESKALSVVESRITDLRSMEDQFQSAMPRGLEAHQLIRDGINALRSVPKLAETDRSTFFGALMTAAQLGLRPNVSSIGHGWVLPFYSGERKRMEAQWIIGYQGMIELAYKSSQIAHISGHVIYENETYKVRYGTNEVIEHEPMFDEERGAPLLYYVCAFTTSGGKPFHVMGKLDVERIRARSRAAQAGKNSPWTTDYDQMALKSCMRQLWKYLPKSRELALALNADEQTRTDLNTAALERLGEPEPQETVVERADAPTSTPSAESPPATATDSARRKPNQTALWKGLRTQAEQVHGPALADATRAVTQQEDPDYATNDELRTIIGFDLQAYIDQQADEAYAAEAIPPEPSDE
jgi:recombination protein RecT